MRNYPDTVLVQVIFLSWVPSRQSRRSPLTVSLINRRVDTVVELQFVSVRFVGVDGLPHPFRGHHFELWVVPNVVEQGHIFFWDLELVRQCLTCKEMSD